MAVTKLFGARIKRREDPRLITGQATYTDDLHLEGLAHAAFVRSPHAHARIAAIDVEAARRAPGVVGVYTGKDLQGRIGAIPTAWLIPNSDLKTPPHPALAVDTVRYVGDGVAVVVAEDRYAARDAAALVRVHYEPLPAVVDQQQAAGRGAPQIHSDVPGNVAFTWKLGDAAATASDFEAAARDGVVVAQRFLNQRLIPNALETRAVVARYNRASADLTVWATTQNPHIARFLMSVVTGIPEHKVRVIAPEVGGGFGSKIPFYPEDAVIAECARALGRPVKWTEDRRENYQATIHGRDHITELEVAARRDGTITAIRGKTWANLGAYLSTAAPGVPTILHGLMLTGCYAIPHLDYVVYGVFTNTTPVDAYRGAGRPEATYLIERMLDLVAAKVHMDPVEVRRNNFIPAEKFPYTTAEGLAYDSGNYGPTLDRALAMIDYPRLRETKSQPRNGRRVGVGFSTYVEICGLGPSAVAGAVGFQGGLWESAVVRMHPTGKATAFTGASPHGQGEETTFAQIVAEELGLPLDDIDVVHGDTAAIPMGWGTYGSRSTVVGGAALALAARRVREKATKIAAHMLEAAEQDIMFDQGRFSVRGSPDRGKTIQEVTLQAYLAWNLPAGVEPALEASAFYDPSNFTFPFGAHAAVVEVDVETGEVRLVRYAAVDDCGKVINPLIVDGQVHGGIAQGIAQALFEQAAYGPDGQLLTGTMADYAVPTAHMLPTFLTDRTETPSPHNPLGVKGVGETGTIASTPAVVNAVMDALRPLGVTHIDMPLTPERIWNAVQAQNREVRGR